jgi:hypothetical protein
MITRLMPAKYGALAPEYCRGGVFDDENTMSFSGASGWQVPNVAIPTKAHNTELFIMLILDKSVFSYYNGGECGQFRSL